jgi:predicted AAA+ superfamily ATPase
LISAQQGYNLPDVRYESDFWGRMVESTTGAFLANITRSEGIRLYYWREGNYEVDFILEYRNKVLAIEVKSGFSDKTRGIKEFSSRYHPDKVLLVGPSGLALEEFLSINPRDLF